MSVARQAQVDLEREKKELEDSFQRISDQAQRKVSGRRSRWESRRGAVHRDGGGFEHCTESVGRVARGPRAQDMVTHVYAVRGMT